MTTALNVMATSLQKREGLETFSDVVTIQGANTPLDAGPIKRLFILGLGIMLSILEALRATSNEHLPSMRERTQWWY